MISSVDRIISDCYVLRSLPMISSVNRIIYGLPLKIGHAIAHKACTENKYLNYLWFLLCIEILRCVGPRLPHTCMWTSSCSSASCGPACPPGHWTAPDSYHRSKCQGCLKTRNRYFIQTLHCVILAELGVEPIFRGKVSTNGGPRVLSVRVKACTLCTIVPTG